MSRRICFLGLDNYPVLNPEYGSADFGGESVQQTLLAKAFVRRGEEVSMIVKDHGQPDEETREGIRVIKTFMPRQGLAGVRYVHPRLTSVQRALDTADADIYYHSCAGVMTGLVASFCRRNARKLVFRIAHDTDCIPGEELIRFPWDRGFYRYGLRRADLVVAQGTYQQSLLDKNLGLRSVVINMAVDMPPDDQDRPCDIDLLWVNNLRPFKRPDLAIDLATRLGKLKIVMIGGPTTDNEAYYEQMRKRAAQVSNLEFKGAVPFHKVNDYFSRSKLFFNTSDSEGFPNSFLQAWARRIPVVSFFDPDGLIASEGLGDCPKDIDHMSASIEQLLGEPGRLAQVGERCRRFVESRYSPDAVAEAYHSCFEKLGA